MPEGYETSFRRAGDEASVARTTRKVVAIPASEIRRESVEWLESGRVPLGMVTILAGVGGLGKSTWTCLLAARNPGVTLIATAEDSPEATVRPRLEAVGADLDRVLFVSVRDEDGIEDGISIPGDVSELEALVIETGATLVVVDPLVAHLGAGVDSHKDAPVRRALAPLYRLAKTHGCAVLPIIHLNKSQGLAPLARLTGSGAFGNAARSVLLLDRDPDDDENGPRRVLCHIKCNVGPEMPSLLFELRPIVLPGDGIAPMVETARLVLLGESAHDARSILAVPSGEARSALDEAMDFLVAELEDGEHRPASDVRRASRSVGISDGTLDRARKRLGVETTKADFGGGWKMRLPKNPSDLDSSHAPRLDSSGDSARVKGLQAIEAYEESIPGTWILGAPNNPVHDELDHCREVLAKPARPLIGEAAYLDLVFGALAAEKVTEDEWHRADRAHRLVEARGRV